MKAALLFIVVSLCCGSVMGQTFADPNFAAVPIGGTGWSFPTGAKFSPDGQKLFVWQKGGKVFVCNRDGGGNYVKQVTPVIDLSAEVADWDAHGLVGFTLDPNFQSNGLIYLMYVVNRNYLLYYGTPSYNPGDPGTGNATIGRITRYRTVLSAGNLVVDASSRRILVGETKETGMPILHHSHGVGSLAFASDGTLLATIGDAASYEGIDSGSFPGTFYAQALADGIIRPAENVGAFRSQMLNSFNGKLLRIDPATGDGIPSNPFYSAAQPRSVKSRVWALGLRNSFRIALRPGTGSTDPSLGDIGEIYMGDVGFASWEELNIVKAPGQNFGWPIYEGNEYTIPSESGGTTYNNLAVQNLDEPNPLYGQGGCTQQYFQFRHMLRQANIAGDKTAFNPCNPSQPIGTGNRYYHNRPALEWSHAHQWARVPIFDENDNPVPAMIGSPESNVPGTPFPGSCSVGGAWYTGDNYPAEFKNTYFQADFVGPLSGSSGPWLKRLSIDFTDVVTRVDNFATGFTDIVCVAVNPLNGNLVTVQMLETGNCIKEIVYGGNQPPIARPKANKIFGTSPLSVNFTGTDSEDPTPGGSIVSYAWNFGGGVPATSNVANPGNIVFTDNSGNPRQFNVTLTVTDNGGATHTETIIVSVNNTPPVVNITSPIKNSLYDAGPDVIYPCTATVTDAEHNAGQLTYEWQTTLRHNTHEHREAIKNEVNSSTLIQRVGFYGTDTYYWLIELTVTDAAGLSTKDSAKIFPNLSGVSGTLDGSITLQGRPAAPNSQWQIPLTVDFYAAGNMSTPAFSNNVTTDNSGNFTIPNITPGNYKIAIKNAHTLRKVSQLETIGGGVKNLNFGTLYEGDAINNNVVNVLDLSLLASSFGKSTGQPGFDARADFNGDGVVNILDLSLLANNFNRTGEAP